MDSYMFVNTKWVNPYVFAPMVGIAAHAQLDLDLCILIAAVVLPLLIWAEHDLPEHLLWVSDGGTAFGLVFGLLTWLISGFDVAVACLVGTMMYLLGAGGLAFVTYCLVFLRTSPWTMYHQRTL